MKLFKPTVVQKAAEEAIKALDMLGLELEELKKRYLNGHHDIQVKSTIVPKDKPNGTADTNH